MNQIINLLAEDIKLIKDNNFKVCITISLTSSNEKNYLTPIRNIGKYKIIGCIINSTKLATIIAKTFKNDIDYFFVDIEKKLPPITFKNKLDSRNIFHPILEIVDEKKLYPFKPNDLTLDAVFDRTISFLYEKRSLKVCVIGLGNIGSKLSLRLVESGLDVIGVPRQINFKEEALLTTINSIKPNGAIAKFSLESNVTKALMASDIILCCATSQNIINEEHLCLLREKKLILDIGKRNVSINLAKKINNVEWLDVGDVLKNYIRDKISLKKSGNNIRQGKLVKAGSLALPGDIICSNPHAKDPEYYGKIDSKGNFKRFSFKESLKKIGH